MYEVTMAVRKQLLADPLLVDIVGDRIYPVGQLDTCIYPYITLSRFRGGDDLRYAGTNMVLKIEIWNKTGYDDLYTAYNRVKMNLDLQTLGDDGQQCLFLYEKYVTDDLYDKDTTTYHLVARYRVKAILDTYINDEWVEAVAKWSQEKLPDWAVHSSIWPMVRSRPCILWRVVDLAIKQNGGRGCFTVSKKLTAHIIGKTPNEQLLTSVKLAEEMGNAYKLPLDIAKRLYVTVDSVELNTEVNPLTRGQLTVTVSTKMARPMDNVPLIGNITTVGNL